MGAVNRVMIGVAGTDHLHVTSTTGYEERQQWGGREGVSTLVFDQWLKACVYTGLDWVDSVLSHPLPTFGRSYVCSGSTLHKRLFA